MPHFFKHRLLLDEGLPYCGHFPRINKRFNVKHITGDFKQVALPDNKVYDFAVKVNRLLVVFNVKDFKQLATKSQKTGIIGVSQNLSTEQIDKKLNSLLSKCKEKTLYGKFTSITGST